MVGLVNTNKYSGYIKGYQFLAQQTDYAFLKTDLKYERTCMVDLLLHPPSEAAPD